MVEHLKDWVIILVAFLGLAHLFIDARGRRRHQENELKFHRQRWQLEAEHVLAQTSRFDKFVTPIADKLKEQLKADPEWIIDAYRRSEIFPYESTTFGKRSDHYRLEKLHIAQRFGTRLISRIEKLVAKNSPVCVVIDSGSTLYPMFEIIAKAALGAERTAAWVDKLEIITNNLPGIFSLMRVARRQSLTDMPILPIKCTVVAGQLLTSYVAVTGPDTQKSIQQLIDDRKSRGAHVISLVTGNWIRLRRSKPECPIPLAAGTGHLEFKQIIMHLAHESYVIAPLGKILPVERDEVRALLSDSGTDYREVDTTDEAYPIDPNLVRLVTTTRTKLSAVLRPHGMFVLSYLDPNNKMLVANSDIPQHMFTPFALNETEYDEELLVEFPHAYTHKNNFYNAFKVNNPIS